MIGEKHLHALTHKGSVDLAAYLAASFIRIRITMMIWLQSVWLKLRQSQVTSFLSFSILEIVGDGLRLGIMGCGSSSVDAPHLKEYLNVLGGFLEESAFIDPVDFGSHFGAHWILKGSPTRPISQKST